MFCVDESDLRGSEAVVTARVSSLNPIPRCLLDAPVNLLVSDSLNWLSRSVDTLSSSSRDRTRSSHLLAAVSFLRFLPPEL